MGNGKNQLKGFIQFSLVCRGAEEWALVHNLRPSNTRVDPLLGASLGRSALAGVA